VSATPAAKSNLLKATGLMLPNEKRSLKSRLRFTAQSSRMACGPSVKTPRGSYIYIYFFRIYIKHSQQFFHNSFGQDKLLTKEERKESHCMYTCLRPLFTLLSSSLRFCPSDHFKQMLNLSAGGMLRLHHNFISRPLILP